MKGNVMGVERCDYYSDEEFYQALHEEAMCFGEQEPEVVPCYRCGSQMYEENRDPCENVCPECRRKESPDTPSTNET